MVKKYLKIWLKTSILSVQEHLAARGACLLYIIGKLIRFFSFVILLYRIMPRTNLAGYTLDQILLFFLVFNLLDIFGQLFFRGIYWFRADIISGKFDQTLLKPLNPIFQVLTSRTDLLDLPLVAVVFWFLSKLKLSFSFSALSLFLILALNGFLISVAIHILVAAIGIMTTEVDNTVLIFRDVSLMARVPVDIYNGPVRAILTFAIPVAVIMTFPAKALMGVLSWQGVIFSFIISGLFFWGSLYFWRVALTRYTSASS